MLIPRFKTVSEIMQSVGRGYYAECGAQILIIASEIYTSCSICECGGV